MSSHTKGVIESMDRGVWLPELNYEVRGDNNTLEQNARKLKRSLRLEFQAQKLENEGLSQSSTNGEQKSDFQISRVDAKQESKIEKQNYNVANYTKANSKVKGPANFHRPEPIIYSKGEHTSLKSILVSPIQYELELDECSQFLEMRDGVGLFSDCKVVFMGEFGDHSLKRSDLEELVCWGGGKVL